MDGRLWTGRLLILTICTTIQRDNHHISANIPHQSIAWTVRINSKIRLRQVHTNFAKPISSEDGGIHLVASDGTQHAAVATEVHRNVKRERLVLYYLYYCHYCRVAIHSYVATL